LYCMAHCLNVVSTHIFSVKLSETDLFGPFGQSLLDNVRALVFYLEDQKLFRNLSKAIPLILESTSGRYNSKVPMLQLLLDQYTQVSFKYYAK